MAFYHDPRLQTQLQYHYLPTTELQQQRKQVCENGCVLGGGSYRCVWVWIEEAGRRKTAHRVHYDPSRATQLQLATNAVSRQHQQQYQGGDGGDDSGQYTDYKKDKVCAGGVEMCVRALGGRGKGRRDRMPPGSSIERDSDH